MYERDKCGECCRNLCKSPIYNELHNGDGICMYLKNDICTIYDDRPLVCRIDECYEVMFKEKISYEDYLELNYRFCKELKKSRRK